MTLNKEKRECGLTLVEVIVVIGLCCIGVAYWLSVPHHRGADAGTANCVNNLKQVGLSFRMWAGDNGDMYPMRYQSNHFDGPSYANNRQMFIYFQIMSNELNTPKVLICPYDERSLRATNFTTDFDSIHVSYFVGMDADENFPNSILAGDSSLRNGLASNNGLLSLGANQGLTWKKGRHDDRGQAHEARGVVAFGDGSVQRISTTRLKAALATNGVATNRIVLPTVD